MQYDFQTMSEKNVFQARLKNEVIDFGFIPVWRFGRFVRFCKKHGLLYQPPTYIACAYLVKHNFKYVRTFSKISHLPLGKLATWVSDFFYPSHELFWPHMKYTWRESCLIQPRGVRPGFTYVVATSAGIS